MLFKCFRCFVSRRNLVERFKVIIFGLWFINWSWFLLHLLLLYDLFYLVWSFKFTLEQLGKARFHNASVRFCNKIFDQKFWIDWSAKALILLSLMGSLECVLLNSLFNAVCIGNIFYCFENPKRHPFFSLLKRILRPFHTFSSIWFPRKDLLLKRREIALFFLLIYFILPKRCRIKHTWNVFWSLREVKVGHCSC